MADGGDTMQKTRLVLDTSVFMLGGSNFTFRQIESKLAENTHVFVFLTCVRKELTKKADEGSSDAVAGLKRLERITRLYTGATEVLYVQQTYADDPIYGYLARCTEATEFISRDRELKQRVYDLRNPHVRVFDITRNGKILEFDPDWRPYSRFT